MPRPEELSRRVLVILPVALSAFLAPLLVSAALTAVFSASASAYAAIEGPPVFSSAPGLPDGRVYEQVSPANKNGNDAGAITDPYFVPGRDHWGYAAPDGDSVLFEGSGPMGESPSPDSFAFVAQRSSAGWSTRAVAPALRARGPYPEALGGEVSVDPSPDLSHAMLGTRNFTLAPLPNETCYSQLYLAGSDPFVPATWLLRPEIENPVGECAAGAGPVGGSPNFGTVYFRYPGTLLPEDAARAPHDVVVGNAREIEAEGLYEDREGVLHEASVLPDQKLDPFGAVPAVAPYGTALDGNQVSENGSRVFFVSPDPLSCERKGPYGEPLGHNNCTLDPPELYVRENGERTLLVSRDTLLPEAAGGLPAAAPSGVLLMPNSESHFSFNAGSYAFASPDGSQAFFQSADALTKPAEEAGSGTEPKTYDFDLETGALTYLTGAAGKIEIVATDSDGSSFAFVKPETGGTPAELDLWSAGANGGSVTSVVQLPGGESVQPARMSSDGSVIAFQTTALIASFNNGGTHSFLDGSIEPGSEQVYRYDVPANTLGCVSCPPHGVAPNGNASMSTLDYEEKGGEGDGEANFGRAPGVRGISANGDRIFFDTSTPLVPQDTNTNSPEVATDEQRTSKQGRDVYEWENDVVYLISGGKSPRDSFLLDTSENGDDVFFATAEGLVPGDTDGAFDVYDARVPRGTPPVAAVPCEGSVCEGPPNVPSPLTAPASATFSGLGNPAAEPAATPPSVKKTATKTVKCKQGYAKRKDKCVKAKVKRKKAKKSTRGSK